MYRVSFDKVEKQLKKVPHYIQVKLYDWAMAVETDGLYQVRLTKGYHDEPLKGHRWGQRSIRLSKSYRAIYTVEDQLDEDPIVTIIFLEEVHKHDY